MLARHRADKSCASCHARFDSIGLVFEGYGPIGERRDEGPGRPPGRRDRDVPRRQRGQRRRRAARVHPSTPPGRFRRQSVPQAAGVRARAHLMLSDDLLIESMRTTAARDGYRFDSLIEAIVTSPQFLNEARRPRARRSNE